MNFPQKFSFSKTLAVFGWSLIFLFSGCRCGKELPVGTNFFSLTDDSNIGKLVSLDMEKMAPVLPEKGNEEIYKYLNRMRDRILATGKVAHARDFDWKIKIMNDDEVENAFCAPGGYIFIFTGILKFVDSEDQLAGVMAHEIAHAANRHYTRQVTRTMPARRITDALLGNSDGLKMMVVGITSLKYNRDFETEADDFSVQYLCSLGIRADGAAGFFKKIEGFAGQPPQWLSTHPSPKNRIKHIEERVAELGCKGTQTTSPEFKRMQELLEK